MAPLISVVVVTYNGKKYLNDCLSALAHQKFRDFEIIVVDNGSSDGSAEYIRREYPAIILVETGKNLGFAGGTNAGIRAARGEFIFTLNNDTIADPNMLGEIIKPMQRDPNIGMCGTKLVFPDGRINSTAICISRSGAAWDRGMGEQDSGQFDKEEEIFGPCAGAALYRRRMLEEVGHFDEDFFLFMEDVDLAFRARLAGWKCLYIPTAQIVHVRGGTATPNSATAIYYVNRNRLWCVIKNFPTMTLVTSSPWIIGRTCVVITYHLLKGNGGAIAMAIFDSLRMSSRMIKKRNSIKRTVDDDHIKEWILTWSEFSKTH